MLSTEVAGGFPGTMVGMLATSQGTDSEASAEFAWFACAGEDAPVTC